MKKLALVVAFCVSLLCPVLAFASEPVLPVFPEYRASYFVIQNKVYEDEYFLFLSDDVLEIGNDSTLAVQSTSGVVVYRYDASGDDGWVKNSEVGANTAAPIESAYLEDMAASDPYFENKVLSAYGRIYGGYDYFTSVVFCSSDLSHLWDTSSYWSDDGVIDWYEKEGEPLDVLFNWFEAYFRNLWVMFTTNVVPIALFLAFCLVGLYFVLRLLTALGLVSKDSSRRTRRSMQFYRPYKERRRF